MTTITDIAPDELSEISLEMERWTPEQILGWAADRHGSGLAMATAFGAEGCALIAMLSKIPNAAYLFNLETGYQFKETLELRDRLMEKYGLVIHFVRSEETVSHMEERFGGPIYSSDPDKCCHIRKVVPLKEAISGYSAWISAIRRDQSSVRSTAPIVGWDKKFNLVKVNPLANWTKRDVWDYIINNEVPYNPLYDQGFASIGCWPCTRAISTGEDERAGRWSGMAKTECGLHTLPTFQTESTAR
jgi:phosphoadenosine phosphosulfate reductase